MTDRGWHVSIAGLVDMCTDVGRLYGRAEICERLGIEMPEDDYALRGPLRLYPPDEEPAA